jgi:hypothetical protein
MKKFLEHYYIEKVELFKSNDSYKITDIENRRFMYNPKTDELILGGNDINISSHAQEHSLSKAVGKFDDFIRGWIGSTKSGKYQYGIIHFAPAIMQEYLDDDVFETIEHFIQHGATKNTIVRNLVKMGEYKLGELFPSYFKKNKINESTELSDLKIGGNQRATVYRVITF